MRRCAVVLSLLCFQLVCVGQEPDIRVSLNDQAKFVISGENYSTLGLQFQSPSGSLATSPLNNDGVGSSGPFGFLLSNLPTEVTYGTLRPKTILDGEVTLDVGWNSLGYKDVTYVYGDDSGNVVGPFSLTPDGHRGVCVDCVPPPLQPVRAGLDDDLNFQISGRGHLLNSLSFVSESGSLRPATSPAPFANLAANTPERIRFEQPGNGYELDGSVTLNAGWNDFVGGRDVRYEYEVVDTQQVDQGPFSLAPKDYPPMVSWPRMGFRFDSDAAAVIQGTGQPVTELTFTSRSNSLIPGIDPGPFARVEGDSSKVTYFAPENQAVILDGTFEFDTKWKLGEPGSARDVRYTYDQSGDILTRGGSISASSYPRERTWPRINVTLDDNDRFVLSGSGHPLKGFVFTSRSGSLIPSDDAEPFGTLTSNTPSRVAYESVDNLILNENITLGAGWDRNGEKDIVFSYDLDKVSRDSRYSVRREAYPIVPVCFDGEAFQGVSISVDRRNRIVVRGRGNEISELELSSESGALVPGGTPAPFDRFESNTSESVKLVSDDPIAVHSGFILSATWNAELETQDIVADFGPSALTSLSYPRCIDPRTGNQISGPNDFRPDLGGQLIGRVDHAGNVIINGNGQQLSGFDLISVSGKLEPVPDSIGPSPFTFLLSNSNEQITWGNLGTTTTIDGDWVTGARYNGNNPAGDILASAGSGAAPTPVSFHNTVIPEPTGGQLILIAVLMGLSLRRRMTTRG